MTHRDTAEAPRLIKFKALLKIQWVRVMGLYIAFYLMLNGTSCVGLCSLGMCLMKSAWWQVEVLAQSKKKKKRERSTAALLMVLNCPRAQNAQALTKMVWILRRTRRRITDFIMWSSWLWAAVPSETLQYMCVLLFCSSLWSGTTWLDGNHAIMRVIIVLTDTDGASRE